MCPRAKCCRNLWEHAKQWVDQDPSTARKSTAVRKFGEKVNVRQLLMGDQEELLRVVDGMLAASGQPPGGSMHRDDALAVFEHVASELEVSFQPSDLHAMLEEDEGRVGSADLEHGLRVLIKRSERAAGGVMPTLWVVRVEKLKLKIRVAYRFGDGEYSILEMPQFDLKGQVLKGFISPPSELTLDRKGCARAGIPQRAQAYSYVYPAQCNNPALQQALLAYRDTDPRCALLTTGGYMYLDKSLKQVVAINAVYTSCPPSNVTANNLFFTQPRPLPPETLKQLTSNERLHATPVELLSHYGSEVRSAWVTPREPNEGMPGLPRVVRPHGCVVTVNGTLDKVVDAQYSTVVCLRRRCCGRFWVTASSEF